MKGNQRLIDSLNTLLIDELTSINQYMVHAEMVENWGYGQLNQLIYQRAMVEMKHAERLIERIIFLEGIPVVSRLDEIHIGSDVPKMFENDLAVEMLTVRHYNEAIALAVEVRDNATREVLKDNLQDEDRHVDQIEGQQDQINQVGIQTYLGQQIKK
jgi:bacterioferritin